MSDTTPVTNVKPLNALYNEIRDWGRRHHDATRREDAFAVDLEEQHLATLRWKHELKAWAEAEEIDAMMYWVQGWLGSQHRVGEAQSSADAFGDLSADDLEALVASGNAEHAVGDRVAVAHGLGQAEGASLMWRDQWEKALRRFTEREPKAPAA